MISTLFYTDCECTTIVSFISLLSFRLTMIDISSIWLHIMISTLFYTDCECNIVSFISLLSSRLTMIDTYHPSDFISWSLLYFTQDVSALLYPLFLFSLSGLHRSTYHPSDFISHDLYTISQGNVSAIIYCLYFSSLFFRLHIDNTTIWLLFLVRDLYTILHSKWVQYCILYFSFSLSGLHRSTYHPSDFISWSLHIILHRQWVHYCILYFSSLFQACNDAHHPSNFLYSCSWCLHY
jgi:hypothetical protein